MTNYLQRAAFRVLLLLWLIYVPVAWALACPYLLADWGTRSEHLRDIRTFLSLRSVKDFAAAFHKGGKI